MRSKFSAGAVFCLALSSGLFAQAAIEWRNIREFGAVPDGEKDASGAIQAAFNTLDPDRGGTVYCPPGAYLVSKTITVSASSVRFIGGGGPSFNEDPPFGGCTLVAKTDGMTLLRFDGGTLNHRGPVIENVNFRDATPSGHTATLLEIRLFNRWTAAHVSLGYANIGLKVNGTPAGDASWGYVPQLVCRNSNICIDQTAQDGGFVVVGGDFEPLVTGIRARGPQVRVIGVKFDCNNASTAVHISGDSDVVTASEFEQCGLGVKIENDHSYPYSGRQNMILGNHFRGLDAPGGTGVEIGSNCSDTQVIGNTYGTIRVRVDDRGSSTRRYEQGVGTNATLSCASGQAIKSITVQQGIVTGVSCGAMN